MKTSACAIAFAIAVTGSAAFAAPAIDDETTTVSMRVSFADLDLSKAAGRATLESRVNSAVKRLCRMPYVSDTRAMAAYRGCIRESWSDARVQLTGIYGRSQYAATWMELAASK